MNRVLALIADRIATRRGAWVTIAIWAAFAVGITVIAQKNPAPPAADAFALPPSAEARQADAAIATDFPQSKGTVAAIVFYRPGGLTTQDRSQAQSIGSWLRSSAAPSNIAGVLDPFSAPGPEAASLVSKDGSALVIQALLADRGGTSLSNAVDAIRRHIGSGSSGLQIRVTGPAGILADLTLLTSKILGNILLVRLLLVLVILAFVYRAPLLALLPVVAVVWAYQVATSLIGIGEHVTNTPINGEATAFVPILMFGAGTDYTLLILSRYRSALTREREAPYALRQALHVVAEPMLVSGGIVFLAALALTVARLPLNQQVGVALAVGIGCVLLAGLTLIPALLTVLGRIAFWPAVPRLGHPELGRVRLWSTLANFVAGHPAIATVLPIGFLVILAAGVFQYQPRFATLDAYLRPSESLQGYALLKQAFGAGSLAPTEVVVTTAGNNPAEAAAVQQALQSVPGVSSVTPTMASADGRVRLFQVQLHNDPYSSAAINLIPELRFKARQPLAAPGSAVLIGGETASSYDTWALMASDLRTVVILVLILVSVMLGLFLRSVLAPVYLLLINALTFGAALGLVLYLNRAVLNSATASVQLPLILFVFLTALGADYNIFLLSRVREEVTRSPLREAVRQSVARTGGVISSAGIILAGTFMVFTTVPVRDGVETGLAIALGILLDTFIVRSLLVPGTTLLLGGNAWWPTKLPTVAEEELIGATRSRQRSALGS